MKFVSTAVTAKFVQVATTNKMVYVLIVPLFKVVLCALIQQYVKTASKDIFCHRVNAFHVLAFLETALIALILQFVSAVNQDLH